MRSLTQALVVCAFCRFVSETIVVDKGQIFLFIAMPSLRTTGNGGEQLFTVDRDEDFRCSAHFDFHRALDVDPVAADLGKPQPYPDLGSNVFMHRSGPASGSVKLLTELRLRRRVFLVGKVTDPTLALSTTLRFWAKLELTIWRPVLRPPSSARRSSCHCSGPLAPPSPCRRH